jgi:hypothetical protein
MAEREGRRKLKRLILPAFGRMPVVEVTRDAVARFHHKHLHIPFFANRCLAIFSKMFKWGRRLPAIIQASRI